MVAIGLFEPPARLMAWFYSFTNNYIVAISIMALIVMVITAYSTPFTSVASRINSSAPRARSTTISDGPMSPA